MMSRRRVFLAQAHPTPDEVLRRCCRGVTIPSALLVCCRALRDARSLRGRSDDIDLLGRDHGSRDQHIPPSGLMEHSGTNFPNANPATNLPPQWAERYG